MLYVASYATIYGGFDAAAAAAARRIMRLIIHDYAQCRWINSTTAAWQASRRCNTWIKHRIAYVRIATAAAFLHDVTKYRRRLS